MSRKSSKKKNKDTGGSQYKGKLDVTRSGVGYVIVEGLETDVLVRPNDFNTALHGDTVRVRITNGQQRGRMQGEVTEVLQRKQTEFMGRIEMNKNFAFFIPETSKPMSDIYIPPSALNNAENGARVLVRITEWEKNRKPQGEVMQILDASDENDLAMKEIIVESGFPTTFEDDVMEEALRLPEHIGEAETKDRRDFRNILTFTIDPVDAKDFDDAISFRVMKNGNYEIGVHIADVSHYVLPETVLDKSAYERATSVYLPDRVNPMLPERISNELCSLRPNEDKLTFSAVFEITPRADVKNHWLGRTVIHSDQRFSYEDVQSIIEKEEGLHKDEVLVLNNISQRLRKQRFKKGAINFSSSEVRFKLDEKGKPIGIVVKESKESHQLIEELMLLANRTVAEDVAKVKVNKKTGSVPLSCA